MIGKKISISIIVLVVFGVLLMAPAFAQRFNVALILPQSNINPDQRDEIRNGFLLATTQRDSHPDETSDGHLGGLDVYVTVIYGAKAKVSAFVKNVAQNEIDLVFSFGSQETVSTIKEHLAGMGVVLIVPGQSPFLQPDLPGVAAFMTSYKRAYGANPSLWAAQGYNGARRIDVAVRDQGGVDDMELLLKSFDETARQIKW